MRPVPAPLHGAGRLADALRRGREKSSKSREQVADEIPCSLATVQRAEAGLKRPTEQVARAFARACGLNEDDIASLWEAAGKSAPGARRTQAPAISFVRTEGDMGAALLRAYEDDGSPAFRELERRADKHGGFGQLNRMAAWRIVRRRSLPSSENQLKAFLTACHVPRAAFPSWTRAWAQAKADAKATARHRAPQARPRHADHVSTAEARKIMRTAGLRPIDAFPGWQHPWTAQCMACGKLSRFRLTAVRRGKGCPVCRAKRPDQTAQSPSTGR
ncbi:multiprotein-bridging factor 1 family protein [Streptomyces sp. NPDC102381]|uniref:helix-turn-helix domain-containing protein n=1 Tax=Streptomyces sp. NPDC102381 TaxID=3366164 RepID=UPI00380D396B